MHLGKKILAVVPARGGSKGIKLKNLRLVKNIPLVGHAGKTCQQLDIIDKAIVSTDHDEIANIASQYGLEVPFMRPEYLSGDQIGDLDVLVHALEAIEEQDHIQYDIILMLQPTSPNRTAQHVIDTVNKLIEEDLDSVWTVSETDKKHHPLKQLTISNDGVMEYYDLEGAKIIARQQLSPIYHRNGVAYAFTRDCLLKQRSIKGKKSGALIINEPIANIDTEEDLLIANSL